MEKEEQYREGVLGDGQPRQATCSRCRLVAEMRLPHALFRWASSARWLHWLSLVRFLLSAASSLGSCLSFALR